VRYVVDGYEARNQQMLSSHRDNELKTRLGGEINELMSSPMAAEFRADRDGIARMGQTEAGQALLADPKIGLKGLWNAVRAQEGKPPVGYGQEATPTPNVQRDDPSLVNRAQHRAVEATPPSTIETPPAQQTQYVPGLKGDTRQMVMQAGKQLLREAQQGRR
jgi:hypothetical protein